MEGTDCHRKRRLDSPSMFLDRALFLTADPPSPRGVEPRQKTVYKGKQVLCPNFTPYPILLVSTAVVEITPY